MTIFAGPVPIRSDDLAQAPAETLAEHRAAAPSPQAHDAHGRVATAGLRGFGGASFPVAQKWEAALSTGGRGIVVANGAESEPVSAKDAALLQLRPNLVLDGLAIAVRATHAVSGVVWLHEGSIHSRAALERAISERRAAGIADPPLRIVEGPAHYLSGEATSIVHALSGGPAVPKTSPIPAAFRGVGDRPTVVHNVETLARVAQITTGRGQDGAKLLTIASPSARTVVDARPHDRLAALSAGLVHHDVSAVLLGGYGGRWHRWDEVAAVPLSELGPVMGAGIVMVLPSNACGVSVTSHIVRYMAASSAKQCGPCIFGLTEISEVMTRVAAGRARRTDVRRLQQISESVAGRGACHHPDGVIRMLASAIDVFDDQFRAHRRSQRCTRRHDVGAAKVRAA